MSIYNSKHFSSSSASANFIFATSQIPPLRFKHLLFTFTEPPILKMAPRIAYVGLGNMGAGMCKNLVAKGNLDSPLLIWNRTASKTEALVARVPNCEVATSVVDAVTRADIIFSCLSDDKAVLQVFGEVLGLDLTGKTLISCSTITPETTQDVARRAKEKGAGFVSMPVFGEPGLAEKGLLVCVPTGPAEDVKVVLPYTTGV
ncbi:hypothetical protein PVAG01_04187 [Phlyctema vagabunda]|uniref:6-phosphogluconate dehydrogenase NADP-binding domain-containing protein n=1 Tax=Phlyctema vagabunda TaxID=108571 RepID=A0ABR4PNK3_9HELO